MVDSPKLNLIEADLVFVIEALLISLEALIAE